MDVKKRMDELYALVEYHANRYYNNDDENFVSREQKRQEKMKLFASCEVIITPTDSPLQLLAVEADDQTSKLSLRYQGGDFSVTIPFTDRASQENAMCCIALMLHLGYAPAVIADRCAKLTPVEMRMELGEAAGNSLLINDSYSLDLNSLTIALDYLAHQHHFRRTLIMSDIPQAGVDDRTLYSQVARLLHQRGVSRFIGIGNSIARCADLFADFESAFYPTTDDFLARHDRASFHNETILLKGARSFGFERIAKVLQRKSHETVMEVNLDALVHNLNYFRSQLQPSTRLMAMVKASSYGAGTVEVASTLQFNHVDYLTVAYIDEGVELRRNGITLPIMVMNPEPAGFDDIVRYRLEPDIYSFRILDLFAAHLRAADQKDYPIHIEFDTGMHRLGFTGADVESLLRRLTELEGVLKVQSVFSHLACSEDPAMDDFTRRQIDRLRQWSRKSRPSPRATPWVTTAAGRLRVLRASPSSPSAMPTDCIADLATATDGYTSTAMRPPSLAPSAWTCVSSTLPTCPVPRATAPSSSATRACREPPATSCSATPPLPAPSRMNCSPPWHPV